MTRTPNNGYQRKKTREQDKIRQPMDDSGSAAISTHIGCRRDPGGASRAVTSFAAQSSGDVEEKTSRVGQGKHEQHSYRHSLFAFLRLPSPRALEYSG